MGNRAVGGCAPLALDLAWRHRKIHVSLASHVAHHCFHCADICPMLGYAPITLRCPPLPSHPALPPIRQVAVPRWPTGKAVQRGGN